MSTPSRVSSFLKCSPGLARPGKLSGFTLIELMIVLMIVALGLALAVPTYNSFMQKRELTAAAEGIHSFVVSAQMEAVKRNEEVTVAWYSAGGHSSNWCVGMSVGTAPCDCTESVVTECMIDDIPYRLQQTDFPRAGTQFFHAEPDEAAKSFFTFDPIRGILNLDNLPSEVKTRIDNDDYIFYVHSDTRGESDSGSERWYGLEMKMGYTGRFTICTQASRQRIIGGFPVC